MMRPVPCLLCRLSNEYEESNIQRSDCEIRDGGVRYGMARFTQSWQLVSFHSKIRERYDTDTYCTSFSCSAKAWWQDVRMIQRKNQHFLAFWNRASSFCYLYGTNTRTRACTAGVVDRDDWYYLMSGIVHVLVYEANKLQYTGDRILEDGGSE